MRIESEGIVLKEIRLPDGRRLIHLFTRKLGKINAGTTMNEKGKSRSALALKPFTVSNYSIFKNRDSYNIGSCEFKKTYYSFGENIEKYIAGSYVLELTEKVLPEGEPAPAVYTLLLNFLEELEIREKKFDTLIICYEVKLLKILGLMPELFKCIECNAMDGLLYMDIGGGCLICRDCYPKTANKYKDSLIYKLDFDILEVLRYLGVKPLADFRKLALKEEVSSRVFQLLKMYLAYHLDIGELKSELLLNKEL